MDEKKLDIDTDDIPETSRRRRLRIQNGIQYEQTVQTTGITEDRCRGIGTRRIHVSNNRNDDMPTTTQKKRIQGTTDKGK